jgi:hypothetical protein
VIDDDGDDAREGNGFVLSAASPDLPHVAVELEDGKAIGRRFVLVEHGEEHWGTGE